MCSLLMRQTGYKKSTGVISSAFVGVTRHTDIIFYVIVFQKYNFLQTTGRQQIGQHFVAYGVK